MESSDRISVHQCRDLLLSILILTTSDSIGMLSLSDAFEGCPLFWLRRDQYPFLFRCDDISSNTRVGFNRSVPIKAE